MKGNKLLVILAVLAIVAVVVFITFNQNDAPVENTDSVAIHLTDENYHETVDNSVGVAFVDFWAAWCSPCVQLAPILEEVASEYDVTLYKLNVDENPLTSAEFQISGIPMVYVYKDGKVVDSQMGLGTKQTYIDLVEKYSD
ncbi:MAG: thioredoxin domain-containing protein [Eubacteriales bacterium]